MKDYTRTIFSNVTNCVGAVMSFSISMKNCEKYALKIERIRGEIKSEQM